MFYTKAMYQGQIVEVELHNDEIYSRCTSCGEEIPIDSMLLAEILTDGGCLASTAIDCCGTPIKKTPLRLISPRKGDDDA